jgi:hypothetical protein
MSRRLGHEAVAFADVVLDRRQAFQLMHSRERS